MSKRIFAPHSIGSLTLKNRIVMAPMTRNRADFQTDSPTDLTALYYKQRSNAGLIITEGTQTSPMSKGYLATPGIFSDAQIAGWKKVADTVHAENGLIFLQLMHCGRISHKSILPNQADPLSASDVQANGSAFAFDEAGNPGFVPCSKPRAIKTEEISALIAEFKQSAVNARKADLDGIELHAANGYLLEQFLNPKVNIRTDNYGGSIQNRARLILETAQACVDAIGGDRVGIRFSPNSRYNDMPEYDDYAELYLYLANELNKIGIGYIHLFDQIVFGAPGVPSELFSAMRSAFKGTMIVCGGLDAQKGEELITSNKADLIAIGRPYLYNPDLVSRYQHNYPLAEGDQTHWYGGNEVGYTDYPVYSA